MPGIVRELTFAEGTLVAAPTIFDALLSVNVRASEGAGTTTLVNGDAHGQLFNLSAARTVVLPSTGVLAGDTWRVANQTTSELTLQSSDLTAIERTHKGHIVAIALQAAPTGSAHWRIHEVYDQVRYTATFSNTDRPFSGTPSAFIDIRRFNKQVWFTLDGISAAANGPGTETMASHTNVISDTYLRPPTTIHAALPIENGGANQANHGIFRVNSVGTLEIYRDNTQALAWGTASTNGWSAASISYYLSP